MHSPIRAGLTAIIAAAGIGAFTVLGAAGAASATPKAPPGPHFGQRACIGVQERTSGAFSDNQDILRGLIVPGSVSVVATQGTFGDNPPVTTFGPGTGYTVSPDWHTVTLQSPYAGSNDGFTTYYAVFTVSRHFRHMPCRFRLQTYTSGAFSNNQDVLLARNIVPGSVFTIATLGPPPPFDSPSVNGFMENSGYTVAYNRAGAVVTLDSPFAGSNDGFTTYYTVVRYFR
jgi:hypothetical protein